MTWPLLAWGAALGPVWVGVTLGSYALMARYATGEAAPVSRYQRLYPLGSLIGIPFGLLAAGFDTVWPDAVITAYVVLSVLIPLAALPSLRHTLAAKSEACESGSSCATCPIACSRHSRTSEMPA